MYYFFSVCGADSVASRKEAVADLAWLKTHTFYTYYGVNITSVCQAYIYTHIGSVLFIFLVVSVCAPVCACISSVSCVKCCLCLGIVHS